ncbi:hypothetical protein D033_4035B, partial [Vibrio parahaemolyticus B-265]
ATDSCAPPTEVTSIVSTVTFFLSSPRPSSPDRPPENDTSPSTLLLPAKICSLPSWSTDAFTRSV